MNQIYKQLLIVGLVHLGLAVMPSMAVLVCIDPGHGGSDPGAVGSGLNESDVNLDISLRARDLFEADGWSVVMTRTTDVYVSLQGRCDYANNNGADRFLCSHCNAYNGAAYGTETYSYSSSGTAATWRCYVNPEMVSHMGTTNRGCKTANYTVLVNTNMAAILCEVAFIDNAGDGAKLGSASYRQEAARAYLHGTQTSYGISPHDPVTTINPPYLFGSDAQGWTAGNSASGIAHTGSSWGGSIYFDQTGNDCWIYSPSTSFTGLAGPQTINVDFYPQSGTSSSHDMQLFWKTDASNAFTASKSSPAVSYTAQNRWVTLNLDVNDSDWWSQVVNQLRLDFDNTNYSTRFIVNHVVLQDAFWWHFSSDTMSWTAGNSLTTPWQTSSETWLGALVTDQNGNDAYMYSPSISGSGWPYNYLGGENDWIHVHVYPQSGTSAIHDMAVYWISEGDGTWNEAKSTHVTYTGQNEWVDVYLPVGTNSNWPAAHVTQLRLDFDQTSKSTRWIVDYIRSDHSGTDSTAPTVPTGLAGTAASQTQVNLSWTASTDSKGVNGYKIYRGGTQIGTSIGTSYSDTTCTPATTYSYTVSAYDAAGNNSSQSSAASVTTPDTVAPSTPTGLTATAASDTQVNLSWTASTDNVAVTGYKIYRGGTQIGTSTTTSYSDTTCTSATTYSYTVSAYDAAGNNSSQSSAASATTPDTVVPSAPTGLTATATSTSQIDLSWTAATDNVAVTGYDIYRDGTFLATVTGTTYSNTGLTMGVTYTYYVVAFDAASNESAQSDAAEETTYIVIDNSDSGFTASTNWATGTSATDKLGTDYRTRATAAVSDTAYWYFTIPTADSYEVYAWWTAGTDRSTTAPYIVYYNGGSQTVRVNQQANGGTWNSLGTFSFATGSNVVRLSCWTTAGYTVVADGIMLIRR
jgi:chitodextrinase